MIVLKSEKEIESIHESCQLVVRTLKLIEQNIRPGITTQDLNTMAEKFIMYCGGRPAFKGFHGFPAALCICLNEQIVHAVPSKRLIQEGDILTLDLGIKYKNYFTDMAITMPIGRVDPEALRLIRVTKKSLKRAISR